LDFFSALNDPFGGKNGPFKKKIFKWTEKNWGQSLNSELEERKFKNKGERGQ
jgi:hypothetical protein